MDTYVMDDDNVDYDRILNHPSWFHRIPLGDGKFTPGNMQHDPFHWILLKLPDRLDGKTFLDIGAFNGLLSFEAERRGAKRVLATDTWPYPTGRQGFELVRKYLRSNVEDEIINVYDISPKTVGKFDVVLCAGLVYHLRDPYLAIKNAVSVANELVVIESALSSKMPFVPAMQLESARPSDPSEIRWAPNLQCLKEMLIYAECVDVNSHSYSPRTDPCVGIPPIKNGIITRPTGLYRDYTLGSKTKDIDAGIKVQVLYESHTSTKVYVRKVIVKHRIIKDQLLGWVDTNDVREMNQTKHSNYLQNTIQTMRRAVNTLKNESVSVLFSKVISNLYSYDVGPRGVVSGHINKT